MKNQQVQVVTGEDVVQQQPSKVIVPTAPTQGVVPTQPETTQVVVQQPQPIVAENGTEQLIVSGIELLVAIVLVGIVGLLYKFRNNPIIAKLNIDPEVIKTAVSKVLDSQKEKIKEEAIKKVREKDIKIPGVHDMTPEEIKEYEAKAKSMVGNQQPTVEEKKEEK